MGMSAVMCSGRDTTLVFGHRHAAQEQQESEALMHSPPDAPLYVVCRWTQKLRKQRSHLSLPLRVISCGVVMTGHKPSVVFACDLSQHVVPADLWNNIYKAGLSAKLRPLTSDKPKIPLPP